MLSPLFCIMYFIYLKLPQHFVLRFLCNSNPIYDLMEGNRKTVFFPSVLHTEEKHTSGWPVSPSKEQLCNAEFMCSKKRTFLRLLPSSFSNTSKTNGQENHPDRMTALNSIYLNQHFKELRENITYSSPQNWFLPSDSYHFIFFFQI